MPSIFTREQRAAYERDGYVMIRGLFDAEEAGMMRTAIEQDPQLRDRTVTFEHEQTMPEVGHGGSGYCCAAGPTIVTAGSSVIRESRSRPM